MLNTNAKKWVKALRSGEYKQGRKALRDGNRYCVLGVACDLYSKAKHIPWEGNKFMDHMGNPPSAVALWLRLKERDGSYRDSDLVRDNDSGVSFSTLASLIESEPKGLFA